MAEKDELLQAVLGYLKKHNLSTTEQALRKEAEIQGDEDSLHVDKMRQVLVNYKTQQHQDRALQQYSSLCLFVEKSLEMYRGELSLVLYPLFVQLYLELVLANQPKLANEFYHRFKDQQEGRKEDLVNLETVTTKEALTLNQTFSHFRGTKYVVKMCKDSFNCLLSHLQDNSHVLLLNLINLHLFVDVFDGLPKQPNQLTLSNTTLVGDSLRSVNEQKMFYGVAHSPAMHSAMMEPEEEEEGEEGEEKKKKKKERGGLPTVKKGKPEVSAPPVGRIPYPAMTEGEASTQLDIAQEIMSRYKISHDTPPSIACYTFLNAANKVNCASLSEDCSVLFAGCQTSAVRIWSLTGSKLMKMRECAELEMLNLADDRVMEMILDEKTCTQHLSLYGHTGPVYDVKCNQQKDLLISCGDDYTVKLWSLLTQSQLVSYRGHSSPVWRCAWSPQGHYFASASADNSALLWSTQHISPVRLFSGHLGDITSIVFHPNGNYVATGSSDRTIRVWDILSGSCIRHLTGHKSSVMSLTFSPHGHLLVSGGSDGTVLVWDITTGSHTYTLKGHTKAVTSLALSREGGVLASGGMDCLVNTWDLVQALDNEEKGDTSSAGVLINKSRTKTTPLLNLSFTRRNLLLAVGAYCP